MRRRPDACYPMLAVGRLLFENGPLLDPERSEPELGCLLVEGGRIAGRVAPGQDVPEDAQRIDLRGSGLAPGFIDLHFHGELIFARGAGLAAALARTCAELPRHGTTSFLVTTVAWPADRLADFVTMTAALLATGSWPGAQPLGLHLEGPWISGGAAGAQPRGAIRPYEPSEGEEVLRRAEGALRMVTLAPEVEGAGRLLATLARSGVVAALGHTLAGPSEIDAATAAGLTHATHLFNAMGPLHQREPGVAFRVMADDRLTCDLICDGAHVHPAVVKLAARAKAERLMLITDRVALPQAGARASGSEPTFGSGALRDDGVALRLEDGRLAGSSLTLAGAIRNLVDFAGAPLLAALAAATLRPARLLGIERERGTLRVGARADLAVLDREGRVRETWIAGERVYATG